VFRRRSTDSSGVLEPDQQAPDAEADTPISRPRPGFTAPKGTPTPKRSDAQANRRQPYQPPSDRKAASKQSRDRNRGERIRRTDAYQRGEQWAMPPKDQGPVRALARDVVDARRGVGEYYMILVIVAVAALLVLPDSLKYLADLLVLALIVIIAIEGWFVGRKVKRLAAERHPGQSTRGVVAYAMFRGINLRRLRMPKPRVKPGDKV
jgi:Protein of unknown function (DUF3043)